MDSKIITISLGISLLLIGSKALCDQNLMVGESDPPRPIILEEKSEFDAARSAAKKLSKKIDSTKEEIATVQTKLSSEKNKTTEEVRRLDKLQGQLKIQNAKLKKLQNSLNSQISKNHRLHMKIADIKTKLAKFSADQNKLLAAKAAKKTRSIASEKN